jgi:hypothetical protein
MWKQWQIEGKKEKGKENADDEDETTLSKVDEKNKHKGRSKEKDDKGKKEETRTCNHCQMKGHIEVNCWKKHPSLMPEKSKGKKTEKAGAAEEEDAEILGDPYSKKSPWPSIDTSPRLAVSPKDTSYQVLGQSRIHHRHTTRNNHPRILAQ